MNLHTTTTYVLDPTIRIVNDSDKCIAYTVDGFFHSTDDLVILHPSGAILLSLFDGSRTFEKVVEDYSFLFDMTNEDSKKMVEEQVSYLERNMHGKRIIVPIEEIDEGSIAEIALRLHPEQLIIPAEKVTFCPYNMRINFPLSVNFNVTTVCGFKCLYCYHPLDPITEYIPLDRLREVFKELKDLGCESILLTGGDPMLRPDIIDVMVALHEIGLFYTLSTKSILSKDYISLLSKKAGLDRIQLSLDSCNPDVVSLLIGVDGVQYLIDFKRMVKELFENSVDVRMKAVLTSYSADFIREWLDFALELGVKHLQVVSYGRSGTRHSDDLYPSLTQMEKAGVLITEFQKIHPEIEFVGGGYSEAYDEPIMLEEITADNIFEKRSICNAGRFSMTILPNGEIAVCEHLPYDKQFILGDLKTHSVLECWNGDLVNQWLSSPSRNIFPEKSPCRICKDEFFRICHERYSRCYRYIYELTGRVDGPDTRCPYASFEKTRAT